MRELIYSDEANDGINLIIDHIGQVSISKAEKYFDALNAVLEELIHLPLSRPALLSGNNQEVRKLVFRKLTVVLYRVDDEFIYVDQVYDARTNWAAGL
jgi:plasmid stabilization system protein ParE